LRRSCIKVALVVLMVSIALSVGINADAADKENCLMCHKYPFVGRVDEDGKRINYHVDEKSIITVSTEMSHAGTVIPISTRFLMIR